jgi:hypothetical protein
VEEPCMDPTMVRLQDTPQGSGEAPGNPETRALGLLANLREEQAGLPREAALAWERAAFREAFLETGPGLRIRAFLEGRRPGD